MEYNTFKELFKKYWETEFLSFEKVTDKLSNNRQMHVFMLIERFVGSSQNMIDKTGYGVIYLSVNVEILATLISAKQVLELCRCGVCFDSSKNRLYMFV